MGRWHRIYLGPFGTKEEAMQHRSELGKKGILLENAILRKKATGVDQEQTTRLLIASNDQKPVSNPSETKAGVPAGDNIALVGLSPPTKPNASTRTDPSEISLGSRKKAMPAGYGRNTPKGSVAIQMRHTFFEVATELSKRYENVTTGTVAAKQDVTSQVTDKSAFPTAMHTDTLRIKY